MLERRSLLRGLVTLPLIGGGVTLIGAPAAPVPLAQAAAVPGIGDPRQRARYAWEAFAVAMRDVSTGADGWRVMGGERITPIPHYKLDAATWWRVEGLRYEYEDRGSASDPFVSEQFVELGL